MQKNPRYTYRGPYYMADMADISPMAFMDFTESGASSWCQILVIWWVDPLAIDLLVIMVNNG